MDLLIVVLGRSDTVAIEETRGLGCDAEAACRVRREGDMLLPEAQAVEHRVAMPFTAEGEVPLFVEAHRVDYAGFLGDRLLEVEHLVGGSADGALGDEVAGLMA